MSEPTFEPKLQPGMQVPDFRLPTAQGGTMQRSAYRGRRHLLLIFTEHSDSSLTGYLTGLLALLEQFDQAGTELLLLVAGAAEGRPPVTDSGWPAAQLAFDIDATVTQRFLSPDARAAVFVIDRYGELYFSAQATQASALPAAATLLSWAEAVDYQCVL